MKKQEEDEMATSTATKVVVLAVLAVFLPACATAGGYGPPINPVTGAAISTSDVLCGAIGVGGGLGTAQQTKNAGFGILVGAAGALLCKAISGAWETRDYHVIQHPPVHPPVYHQPGAVVIPSGIHIPDGYQMERIDVQNATRGVIFVRTPQGMVRVEPGGMLSFYEAISTGAGGAFYAVHATATVHVPGGYQSKWAHEFGHSNGTLARTVVFKDFRWDNKIVPAYAAERHEIVPPPTVHGAPGVQAEPAPPSPPK